ncbi:flagellar hook-basal body complex protein FliE [Gorillibacterium massiliense]|uniref:flagellar hook-basal body complex protein FliE n=1 Tax=Gorillibacterium massiliense TaxID=1280390 RepID=UPI0004B73ABE|nr:flagellar hook-basal body complex protein FliE [Gorillibacterium massiliense]
MIDKTMLSSLQPASLAPKAAAPATGTEIGKQFGDFLNDALTQMNNQQAEADKLSQQYIMGEITDPSQALIATEKVSLGLELAVQTRNKVIEAYQDIMRMQI